MARRCSARAVEGIGRASTLGVGHEVSAWKLGGLTPWELGRRIWSSIQKDEISDRAAALSYYFLFSLFPALLFLTALLGLLPIPDLMARFMGYFAEALPDDAASVVDKTLTEIVRGAHGGLLSIGMLGALWAGSNGMGSVMTALNVAYRVSETRPWWKRRLIAMGLTLGFALFVLSALVLLVFGPRLGSAVAGWFGLGPVFMAAWNLLSMPMVILFALVGIALVYYLAPDAEQRWQWVTPGSAVALVLWLAMSFGLRLYVNRFANYNTTYGSIGGVILLTLWLYLTGVVLLLGAEVNSEIEFAAAQRGDATAKLPGEHVADERRRRHRAA
jgi:membrane protein